MDPSHLARDLGQHVGSQRLRLALIDGGSVPQPGPNRASRSRTLKDYSNRVSFITHENYAFVKGLAEGGHPDLTPPASDARALWKDAEEEGGAWPVDSMHIWDRDGHTSAIHLRVPGEGGNHLLGRIVENRLMIETLTSQNRNCTEFGGESVRAIQVNSDQVHLQLANVSGGITCACVVGADGRQSIVQRQVVKPEMVERRYGQKGLVATLQITGYPKGNTTVFQRFLPSGPLAMLPLGPSTASMVWTLPDQTIERLLASRLDAEQWRWLISAGLHLQTADVMRLLDTPDALRREEFTWRQDALEQGHRDWLHHSHVPIVEQIALPSLAAFPLSMCHAQRTVAPRAIIIGYALCRWRPAPYSSIHRDAAHVIHPLAGQGVNLGLGDVRKLTQAMAEAASLGSDLGNVRHYRAYHWKRQLATLGMTGFVDGVHRLYHHQGTTVGQLRRRGMALLGAITPLSSMLQRVLAGRR